MVSRRGFGLIEVIIAITLLGIGVITVSAGAAFATRMLRSSENHEDAADMADTLIDSLVMSAASSSGERDDGRFHARWEIDGAAVRVTITPRGADDAPVVAVTMARVPALLYAPCDSAVCHE